MAEKSAAVSPRSPRLFAAVAMIQAFDVIFANIMSLNREGRGELLCGGPLRNQHLQ